MKLATMTVSLRGYHDSKWNPQRLKALEEAFDTAKREGVESLCTPGGYLYASLSDDLQSLTNAVVGLARKYDVAVAVCIDEQEKDPQLDWSDEIRLGTLPWYVVCWSPDDPNTVHVWNQRSVTSQDQGYASDTRCLEARRFQAGGEAIEVLICGELFNKRIQRGTISRKPKAVVDLVHTLQGYRSYDAMRRISTGGIHCFCSGHAGKHKALNRYFAPGGIDMSDEDFDYAIQGPPRLEVKIWHI